MPAPVAERRPERTVHHGRERRDDYAWLKDPGYPEVTDHNHPDSTGFGAIPVNQNEGLRVSTAIAYLLPARHRLNLTIRPHCLVNRVLFDGNRAIGVEVESSGVAQRVEGRRITTVSGLSQEGQTHPVVEAFITEVVEHPLEFKEVIDTTLFANTVQLAAS